MTTAIAIAAALAVPALLAPASQVPARTVTYATQQCRTTYGNEGGESAFGCSAQVNFTKAETVYLHVTSTDMRSISLGINYCGSVPAMSTVVRTYRLPAVIKVAATACEAPGSGDYPALMASYSPTVRQSQHTKLWISSSR